MGFACFKDKYSGGNWLEQLIKYASQFGAINRAFNGYNTLFSKLLPVDIVGLITWMEILNVTYKSGKSNQISQLVIGHSY